ncbi:UDP-2,4-diacetamido-2,4,6-trideoxy-beta-L-altropyranose hydrolase [Limnohabitans sp. B9-3]|uniref:UDP-2,4-diacetamido-2,4, 6-trideoxy-beta-L-altropyranose hydrolase n=1 Tax=Limnohabitans sp. B9-3 TaxID=1100707 RepID=UPI000C1F0EA9|nr:UDP-2,4-diacetamido-2,4,6-trideoxy-beta-L-altropyranose hydrolase [Limnohabitans sp. B9-3]PIT76123.1 UDP-2,4-diacetamido-2,4,6-trideoxy-beta-L-altropyranose hydrolase [Limnohabitans sp. B9-3]
MASQRIAFRTDANSEIGTGHFMRCLTLADALKKQGSDICFVARGIPEHLLQMLHERNFAFHALPESVRVEGVDELAHSKWLKTSQHLDAVHTLEKLGHHKFDWLIVDHYAIDQRWESTLRVIANRLMVIDDLADRSHDCDVLLDQNYYRDAQSRYVSKVPAHCQMLLGPAYALLRKEFTEMRKHVMPRMGEVRRVLVFFGGVDAENLTGMALKALIELNLDIHVDVVIGQQHPKIQEIESLCKTHFFACHVQTKQMAHLMAQADLAIGAGGASIWERFCMGLPSICISTADNQRQQIADLQFEDLVFAPKQKMPAIEFLNQVLRELKSGLNFRAEMSEKIYQLVDGHGVVKVSNLIFSGDITMRLADKLDSKNIFTWRNHPTIRSKSLSADEIQWVAHEKWFDQRCGQLHNPLLIGEIDKKPVGVVRFDITETLAEVSIYLVPESGNHGHGRKLLGAAEDWLKTHHPHVDALHAKVLQQNESSKRLFANLNYIKHVDADPIEFVKKL